jgi:hypothetical protein
MMNCNYIMIVAITTIETHFLSKQQLKHIFSPNIIITWMFQLTIWYLFYPAVIGIVSPLTSNCSSIQIVVSLQTEFPFVVPMLVFLTYPYIKLLCYYCSLPLFNSFFNHYIFIIS